MEKIEINGIRVRDRRTHKLEQKKNVGEDKIDTRKVAFLYIRVSTDEQADRGYSQRDQDQRLQEYCERQNIKVGRVIYEDFSAKTFKRRPEWSKMLLELKKTRGRICDLILFTKWDRFSRNAANAYEMIDILETLNITPNAIDQYLDLKIPESRIMLAVYIAQAEADNLRRGLNVVAGMRRGKSEGRWMGKAPAGYINRIKDKVKYIEPLEPEASHLRWAFETLATGAFNAQAVWRFAKARGLKCSRVTFTENIRNPIYCGKIVVPPDEHNESYLVDGKHEPIISEKLFWDVQDLLNGRRKPARVNTQPPKHFPLRGFILCPNCNKLLTGSGSKGRTGEHYYYYHCRTPCRGRYLAADVNKRFEIEIRKFVPKPGIAELFKEIVCDVTHDDSKHFEEKKSFLVTEISAQNNVITKIRAMLLSDDITTDDYKIMKTQCEQKIIRLEAELETLKKDQAVKTDFSDFVDEALIRLQNLLELYQNGDIEQKRFIIGSIYPEKWRIFENDCRNTQINSAALFIYQINRVLGNKKAGVRTKIRTKSGSVPSAGVEPARFPTGV
ncbi:recombinase family protein [Pedobacter borealis]|uniref:recombinase family protein n=1 Tax=Pedobacter borealis TaxID=475254 RepID=UPI003CC91FD8